MVVPLLFQFYVFFFFFIVENLVPKDIYMLNVNCKLRNVSEIIFITGK